MKEIKLSNGLVYLLDDDSDQDRQEWKLAQTGYLYRYAFNQRLSLHREVLGLPPSCRLHVHHKNGNKLDNRRENLDALTVTSHRMTNGPSKGKKYKGTNYDYKMDAFYAVIHKGNQRFRKGPFKTEEEAALAYNKLALTHFGEGVYLNGV